MLSIDEAVKSVQAGAKQLSITHTTVTIDCQMKDDKPVFKASFPSDAPEITESVFRSLYYGKTFSVVDAKKQTK